MKRPPLLGTPYRAPKLRIDDHVFDEHLGHDVVVADITDSPPQPG